MTSSTIPPNRFQELEVKGFRRLENVAIPLRPLCVMIGANGVGKSSILDVLLLLANSARGNLNNAMSDLSGLPAVLTYDRAERLRFGISMGSPGAHIKYALTIQPQGAGYVIEEERLYKTGIDPFQAIESHGLDVSYFDPGPRRFVRPSWEHNPLETSLAQVPKMFRQPEEFRTKLASSTFYHVLNVEARSPIRLPQPVRPATLPGSNGEDLVSCLFYLREADRHRFDAVEDSLKAAFPGFERLDFPPVAAGTLALTWREKYFTKPLYMHQLSEGMLRFLWLATLLQSPGLTALTLLDEPEVSLHPELLGLLAGLLREASQRTQVIVATHSDRLVRFLKPEEVVVLDANDDGSAKFTWADQLDLGEWLKEYTLDELWTSGRIGARS
jgi:predicted ATPase